MKYLPLDGTNYTLIIVGAGMIAIILCLAAISFRYKWLIATASAFSLAMLGFTMYVDSTVKPAAQQKAVSNLSQKYDIKAVDWESKDTTVGPISKGGGEIVVEVKDGEKYIFGYAVNRETGEPTLTNIPTRGGATSSQAVTAESLQKSI